MSKRNVGFLIAILVIVLFFMVMVSRDDNGMKATVAARDNFQPQDSGRKIEPVHFAGEEFLGTWQKCDNHDHRIIFTDDTLIIDWTRSNDRKWVTIWNVYSQDKSEYIIEIGKPTDNLYGKVEVRWYNYDPDILYYDGNKYQRLNDE